MWDYFKGFGAEEFNSLIRHTATAIGPLLAFNGVASEADVQAAAGVAIAVGGIVWGQASPEKRAMRRDRAERRRRAQANR